MADIVAADALDGDTGEAGLGIGQEGYGMSGHRQTIEETADEILEASIDPQGLSADDLLDDDQAAILHTKIVEILSDRFPAAVPAANDNDDMPPDVRRLVIAARVVAFESGGFDAISELDKASEAFADRVPWEGAPGSPI